MALIVVLRVPRQSLLALIVSEGTIPAVPCRKLGLDLCKSLYYNEIQKGGKKMSFYEYLLSFGIDKQRANAACVLIENDLIPEEPIESMYWTWWNNQILKKGDEL